MHPEKNHGARRDSDLGQQWNQVGNAHQNHLGSLLETSQKYIRWFWITGNINESQNNSLTHITPLSGRLCNQLVNAFRLSDDSVSGQLMLDETIQDSTHHEKISFDCTTISGTFRLIGRIYFENTIWLPTSAWSSAKVVPTDRSVIGCILARTRIQWRFHL